MRKAPGPGSFHSADPGLRMKVMDGRSREYHSEEEHTRLVTVRRRVRVEGQAPIPLTASNFKPSSVILIARTAVFERWTRARVLLGERLEKAAFLVHKRVSTWHCPMSLLTEQMPVPVRPSSCG